MVIFTTTALGAFGGAASSIDVRLLRDQEGGYRILAGSLGEDVLLWDPMRR